MTVPSGWSFGKSSEAAEKPDRQINPIEKKEEEMKMEKGEVKMLLNRIKMLVVSAGNLFQEYLVTLLGSTNTKTTLAAPTYHNCRRYRKYHQNTSYLIGRLVRFIRIGQPLPENFTH